MAQRDARGGDGMSGYSGDCTFDGVSFVVEEDRALLTPLFAPKAKSAVREVPYGNRAIYQYLGRAMASVTVRIIILTASYAGFAAKVGNSGTLALFGGPSVSNVVLDGFAETGMDSINGLTELTATFLRVP